MSDSAARARLDRWKQSLLDPNERLLDLGDSGIPIAGDPIRLAFTLAAGGGLALEDSPLAEAELWPRLTVLRRATRAAERDGEHVLWLALGLLTWSDGEGTTRTAPLVLWPVEIEKGTSPRIVGAADKRPRINDMLFTAH